MTHSASVGLQPDSAPLGCRATIYEGAALFDDAIPISVFTSIAGCWPDGIIDSDLARVAGVAIAIGRKDACATLKKSFLPHYRRRVMNVFGDSGLGEGALEWLVSGEHGASSRAMFAHLSGLDLSQIDPHVAEDRAAYPRDPDDFRRCRLLLDRAPEFAERLDEMSSLSPLWSRLVPAWPRLCALMDSEVPNWRETGRGSAPETKALMDSILGDLVP